MIKYGITNTQTKSSILILMEAILWIRQKSILSQEMQKMI